MTRGSARRQPWAWLLLLVATTAATAATAGGSTATPPPPLPPPPSTRGAIPPFVGADRLASPLATAVPCADTYDGDGAYADATTPGCLPGGGGLRRACGRYIEDGLLSDDEVAALRDMVAAGMVRSGAAAGPTILDLNTGFMRDTMLQNIYRAQRVGGTPHAPVNYTATQYALYASVYERIHARLRAVFNLSALYFTAPTFVTRIRGAPDWQPASDHDEYYHTHSDKLNTAHYDYSGLVYLSTGGGVDFDGGDFHFSAPRGDAVAVGAVSGDSNAPYDGDAEDTRWRPSHTVRPRRGRLLLFTAGEENMHNVDRVTGGERFVFSMWFTCHPGRTFSTFLDGKAHVEFDNDNAAPTAAAGTTGIRIGHDVDTVYDEL